MTEDRIAKLNDVGFVWDASSKCANRRDEKRWQEMFLRLKKYKEKNGDCLVPTKYSADPKLGNWVSNERRHFKLFSLKKPTSMTEDRKRKLEEVGFVFLVPSSSCSRKSAQSSVNSNISATITGAKQRSVSNSLQIQQQRNKMKSIQNIPNSNATNSLLVAAAATSTVNVLGDNNPYFTLRSSSAIPTNVGGVHSTVNAFSTNISLQTTDEYGNFSLDDSGVNVDNILIDAIVNPMLKDDGVAVAALSDEYNSRQSLEQYAAHLANSASHPLTDPTLLSVSMEDAARAAAAMVNQPHYSPSKQDTSRISVWVCDKCGKTTFLKRPLCCGQIMAESVVANI